jgi:hypothetical protein
MRKMIRRNPGGIVDHQEYGKFVKKAARTDLAGRLDRYPDLQPAELPAHYPHLDDAVENHEMWHQKEVEGAYRKNVSFPSKMVCIGYATEIVYVSDKWEPHADFYDYIHDFDSTPPVFADARRHNGSDQSKTTDLIGVRSVSDKAKLALPILARVAQFTIADHDGKNHQLRFDFPPLMLCSPDKEGLIILSDEMGPIVVRGGQMEITERGIVK